MPFTQEQLGEATGMSSVHVNRALMVLRNEGAISLKRGKCDILDQAKLSPEVLEHLVIRRVPPALSLDDLVAAAEQPWAERMAVVFGTALVSLPTRS